MSTAPVAIIEKRNRPEGLTHPSAIRTRKRELPNKLPSWWRTLTYQWLPPPAEDVPALRA